MTYTIDNINEFFDDLMNKLNAKLHMFLVYDAYKRDCELDKRREQIADLYDHIKRKNIIHVIGDNIAIVEQRENSKLCGYYAHVYNHKSYVLWPTFEQALICAVSIKLTGREDATEWMWKLVGGN